MFWKANEVYLAAMPACFAFALNENSNVNPYSWAFLFKNCSPPNTSFEVYQKNISATSCCDVFNIQQLKIPASFLTSWLHLENLWSFIHNIEQTPHIFNLTDPSEAIYQLSAPPKKWKQNRWWWDGLPPFPLPVWSPSPSTCLKRIAPFLWKGVFPQDIQRQTSQHVLHLFLRFNTQFLCMTLMTWWQVILAKGCVREFSQVLNGVPRKHLFSFSHLCWDGWVFWISFFQSASSHSKFSRQIWN